jgi:putative transposase
VREIRTPSLTRRGLETGHSGTAPVLEPTSEGLRVKSPRSTQPFIPMAHGYMYLVAIMDWHSRKVLSWRISNTLDNAFCIEALHEALSRYGAPAIFNTDQGAQFTSNAFTRVLEDHHVAISMDGRGRCQDNIFVERLWWTLKHQFIYLHAFDTGKALRQGLGRWLDYYNHERGHSALDDRTPDEVYYGLPHPFAEAA